MQSHQDDCIIIAGCIEGCQMTATRKLSPWPPFHISGWPLCFAGIFWCSHVLLLKGGHWCYRQPSGSQWPISHHQQPHQAADSCITVCIYHHQVVSSWEDKPSDNKKLKDCWFPDLSWALAHIPEHTYCITAIKAVMQYVCCVIWVL